MKNAQQHPLRNAWLAALVIGAASLAHASTVTYDFSQSGFDDGGTLTGTFSGTPEAGGIIQLADLTNFSATFHLTVGGILNTFNFTVPTAFTYDPTSGDPWSSRPAARLLESNSVPERLTQTQSATEFPSAARSALTRSASSRTCRISAPPTLTWAHR